jgi:hypothetical protein
VGLPGVGKSTLLATLAERNGWQRFAEPEEALWPEIARDHSLAGVFTALTWFRAMRVANLYAAARARQAGQIAVVDSYYDKLMTYYIKAPQMDWLVPRDDPYFDLLFQIALTDHFYLPTADVIILFTATFENWERCIKTRQRQLDVERVFPHAFPFQDHLRRAVREEGAWNRSRVVVFENRFGSIERAVEDLAAQEYLERSDGIERQAQQ